LNRTLRAGMALLLLAPAGIVVPADPANPIEAPTLATDPAPARSFLADLPPALRAALDELDPPVESLSPWGQLELVFRSASPYEFESGPFVVLTDSRWFTTQSSTGPTAPLLELRRWPGDTCLALYAVAGPMASSSEGQPPVPDGTFELQPDAIGAWRRWDGEVENEAGARPAVWLERTLEDAPAHVGALLLPGDAGFGAPAIDDLTLELLAVVNRLELLVHAWKLRQGIAPDQRVSLPVMPDVPGDLSEEDHPWQVVRGRGFTMGLPPGFRARRLDGSVPAPIQIPGGLLWIRGRLIDQRGGRVAVGDDRRVGYVAEVRPPSKDWLSGARPPYGAGEAEKQAAETFDLLAERTGAKAVRVENWSEPGWSGEWLVCRIMFRSVGYEIVLPVLAGERSPAVYWIALSWRPDSKPPASPPVDPAQRFGIRFERLRPSEQTRQPWTAGILWLPGLRTEVPKGWVPLATLRSSDGYPIRFVADTGATVARLERLEANELPSPDELEREWETVTEFRLRRAAGVHRSGDRYLVLSAGGYGFLYEPLALGIEPDDKSRIFWVRMVKSSQLLRSEP